MTADANALYGFLETAYRKGVLDKFLSIFGQALEGAMEDAGVTLEHLINNMDGANEETVKRLDSLLERSEPFLRLAGTDRSLNLLDRLVDISLGRQAAVSVLKRFLFLKMTGDESRLFPQIDTIKTYMNVMKQTVSSLGSGPR